MAKGIVKMTLEQYEEMNRRFNDIVEENDKLKSAFSFRVGPFRIHPMDYYTTIRNINADLQEQITAKESLLDRIKDYNRKSFLHRIFNRV